MKLASTINRYLKIAGVKLVRIEPTKHPYTNIFDPESRDPDGMTAEAKKLMNLLSYTKASSHTYNGALYESGYHTIVIDGKRFQGQRDPAQRLESVPFDFQGASVLDLGSNQGGMLFAVADKIRSGVGVDFDYKMVNVANRITRSKNLDNLNFYVFDLEKENLQVLRNLLSSRTVDIIFLLAVCMWISNWKQVIDFAASVSNNLLFESNGTADQQANQEHYLATKYQHVIKVRDTSPDNPADPRKLFLCENLPH